MPQFHLHLTGAGGGTVLDDEGGDYRSLEHAYLEAFAGPPASCGGRRIQIEQVLLNLLRNAVEAMQTVERRELAIATAIGDSDMVEISVADTGAGMDRDVAARLFRPFVSTKGQGMGVGLSISRTIVEVHGGRIWVEPNPEGGTIFRYTIPLAPELDEEA
jgi:two-component system, LuxR family, sensor kinase FixL